MNIMILSTLVHIALLYFGTLCFQEQQPFQCSTPYAYDEREYDDYDEDAYYDEEGWNKEFSMATNKRSPLPIVGGIIIVFGILGGGYYLWSSITEVKLPINNSVNIDTIVQEKETTVIQYSTWKNLTYYKQALQNKNKTNIITSKLGLVEESIQIAKRCNEKCDDLSIKETTYSYSDESKAPQILNNTWSLDTWKNEQSINVTIDFFDYQKQDDNQQHSCTNPLSHRL